MSTHEQQVEPVQMDDREDALLRAVEVEDDLDLVDDEYHPQTKSGVRNSREVVLQNAKFQKGEWVHMSVIANGSRSKGVFKIYAAVYNPAGWVDYQLIDPYTNQLHNRGAAVRERDLKAGQ